jgi:hypothetical protein
MGGGASMVAEIRALRQELQAVVSGTNRTAIYTKRTADRLELLSPNGDALVTEALE